MENANTSRVATGFIPNPKLKLLDQVSEVMRFKHYSIRTERTYREWIRRYILFHGKRHPREMGGAEVSRFLSDLAVTRHVAASTQNQAFNALLFLYREVLHLDWGELGGVERAKRPQRLPVVLSKDEVMRVLDGMSGTHQLMAKLLFGTGHLGSNQGPLACEASALPLSYAPGEGSNRTNDARSPQLLASCARFHSALCHGPLFRRPKSRAGNHHFTTRPSAVRRHQQSGSQAQMRLPWL